MKAQLVGDAPCSRQPPAVLAAACKPPCSSISCRKVGSSLLYMHLRLSWWNAVDGILRSVSRHLQKLG